MDHTTPQNVLTVLAILAIVGLSASVLAAIAFCGSLIFRVARGRAKKVTTLARDRLANQIVKCMASGDTPPPFALYLRPFQSTGYRYFSIDDVGNQEAETVEVSETLTGDERAVQQVLLKSRLRSAKGGASTWGPYDMYPDQEEYFGIKNDNGGRARIATLQGFNLTNLLGEAIWFVCRGTFVATYRLLSRLMARQEALSILDKEDVTQSRAETSHLMKSARRGQGIYDFEDLLEDALRDAGEPNLIALGMPGEHSGGAGRVRVADSEWQNCIRFMLAHSKTNLLVLSPRPGTLWEIEAILTSELWKKTIFIMPPTGGFVKSGYSPGQDSHTIRDKFTEVGVQMPPPLRRGCAWVYHRLDGEPMYVSTMMSVASASVALKYAARQIRKSRLVRLRREHGSREP